MQVYFHLSYLTLKYTTKLLISTNPLTEAECYL